MLREIHTLYSNRILAMLDARPMARLRPWLEPVKLAPGTLLETPGEIITHVHFPEAGLGSVMALGPGGQRVEAALFGREGMSGLPVVLGSDRTSQEVRIQHPGHGYRIRVDALREVMRAEPSIRDLFLLYVLASLGQSANTTLANARLSLEARLARWLLMCHDRLDGDQLELTHEFLSVMLGVRRAGVTVAVHVLEGRGLIRATRGRIRILDRAGLERSTRGVYGLAETEYARLMSARAGEVAGTAARPTSAPFRFVEREGSPAPAAPGVV